MYTLHCLRHYSILQRANDGLAGTDIPVGARVIAVCDAWATTRTGGRNPDSAESRQELLTGRGTKFDPAVVDAFLALLDEGALDEPVPGHRLNAGQHGTADGA